MYLGNENWPIPASDPVVNSFEISRALATNQPPSFEPFTVPQCASRLAQHLNGDDEREGPLGILSLKWEKGGGGAMLHLIRVVNFCCGHFNKTVQF